MTQNMSYKSAQLHCTDIVTYNTVAVLKLEYRIKGFRENIIEFLIAV